MAGPFKDAIDDIEPKSRSRSGWFFIILILFIVGAYYFTVDANDDFVDHSATEDMDSLIYGFQSLAVGDISGFFEGIVGGLSIVALFIVMFALMHFLFSTALKPVFPNKKYATIMALVLTIYAFVNPKIYNYLLNLNAFAVGFFVFLALVIMMWSFTSKSGKDMLDSFDAISNLKKNPELINDKEYVKKLKKELAKERKKRGSNW